MQITGIIAVNRGGRRRRQEEQKLQRLVMILHVSENSCNVVVVLCVFERARERDEAADTIRFCAFQRIHENPSAMLFFFFFVVQEMAQWVFLLAAEMQRGDGTKRVLQTYPMTFPPPVCTVLAIFPISPILPPP
jgi:hypothetical protein